MRTADLTGDGPVVLGVAARLARRVGAAPSVVRVGFCVLALAAGWGIVLYVGAWLLLAGRSEPVGPPVTLRHNLGVLAATAAQLVLARSVAGSVELALLGPAALVAFALALSDPTGAPAAAAGPGGRARPNDLGRIAAGLVLMSAGSLSALAGAQDLSRLLPLLPAVVVVVGGLLLVIAPWFRGVLADAAEDRRERVLAEARADMAAHLHDSVLQTLTLIQNRAGEPEVAAALAHHQERELRRWLYGADRSRDRGASLRVALEEAAAEVEDQYLKFIECVVVGDAPLDDDLAAVVGAAREAMVNASKFADISMISVYAEVVGNDDLPDGNPRVTVFVRDRGVGFDRSLVPADRHGITDSIEARVARVGGTATVRSTLGAGTEVALRWPT